MRKVKKWWLGFAILAFFFPSQAKAIEQTQIGFYYPIGTNQLGNLVGFLSTPPEYFTGLYHLGKDIKAQEGVSVYAIADGELVRISRDESGWGSGNVGLIIRHRLEDGSSFFAVYGHLRTNLSEGVAVSAGQVIGAIGHYKYGSHLHFGIYPGENAPTSPLGRWYLPKGWKNGDVLDPKGFVDPIKWIEEKRPHGTRPSGMGKIIFCLQNQDGQTALWTINLDGSGLSKWRDWNKDWGRPSFSFDSRKMFFSKYNLNSRGQWLSEIIVVQELASGETKQIAPLPEDYDRWTSRPCVAPDDQRIVYEQLRVTSRSGNGCSLSADKSGIWISNLDGSGAWSFGEELFSYCNPIWSPNGTKLLLTDCENLSIYDLKSKSIIKLTNDFTVSDSPNQIEGRWSPSGDWIAFRSGLVSARANIGDFWHDIQLIRPNGQERHLLVFDERYIDTYDWSCDGKEIVYLVRPFYAYRKPDQKGQCRLSVVNVQDRALRRTIFTTPDLIDWVMWSSFKAR